MPAVEEGQLAGLDVAVVLPELLALQHAAVAVQLVDPEVGLDRDEAALRDAQVAFDREVAELFGAFAQGNAARFAADLLDRKSVV